MRVMKGMTIDEIAEELGIPWKTAHKRIEKIGEKPLSYKAIYDPSIVEKIRDVKMGRPKKINEQKRPVTKSKKLRK
jgi:predicted ArsR family transcriptional regulator